MSITCLIPSYNEAGRIRTVLDAANAAPSIERILVLDDCSRDNTAQVVAQYPRVELKRNEVNLGKTRTIARGLREVDSEHILLLDADLTGLTAAHLERLIAPVKNGMADLTISLRGNSPRIWKTIGIDYISGERVLPRTLFDGKIEALEALPKFGLEVFMNQLILAANLSVEIVPWPEVSSPYKIAKRGRIHGLWAEAAMLNDIFHVITPWEASVQIRRLKKASRAASGV